MNEAFEALDRDNHQNSRELIFIFERVSRDLSPVDTINFKLFRSRSFRKIHIKYLIIDI